MGEALARAEALEVVGTAAFYMRLEPDAFDAIARGQQRAVVVEESARVEAGDQIVIRKWQPAPTAAYTGDWMARQVTHVVRGGVGTGVVVHHLLVSLNAAAENEWASTALRRALSLAERQGVSPERFWRGKEQQAQALRPSVDDVIGRQRTP